MQTLVMELFTIWVAAWIIMFKYPRDVKSAYCLDAYECAFDSISETGTTGLNCFGYYSCGRATLLESPGQSPIYCFGSYSCYKARVIQHTSLAYSRYITCYSLYSCAMVNHIYNENGPVVCYGELSCFQSKIFVIQDNLSCAGVRSCAQIVAVTNNNNWFGGYLSAQNATFYSNNSFVNYYFRGSKSGYDATIICNNNHTCNIECNTDACNNLKLKCNGNCTFIINCDFAEKSDICPNGYQLQELTNGESIPSLLNVTMSDYSNSYEACYTPTTGAINCGDDQECQNELLDTRESMVSVCCNGYRSCRYAINITTVISLNSTNVAVRCDGYYGCDDVSHIIAVNGGNIYLTTYDNAASVNDADGDGIIETNEYYDIFCTGYFICRFKILRFANNLYCVGNHVCYKAKSIEFITNVWIEGYGGAYGSNISHISHNVYCHAYQACYNSKIYNVSNNVYCYGYRSCYNSIITNVTKVCN